jgi:hypothetical protein
LCGDVGFWVKNGGWYVKLQSLGDMGKKNASKNEHKLAKISINSEKFVFFSKNS